VVRKLAKAAGLGLLRSAGGFSLAARSQRRNSELLILCYHGISLRDEHEWAPSLYVTAEVFRQRMEQLKTFQANVLPLAASLERLKAGTLPPRSVAITFDDGFYDFLLHAVPVLKQFGFPATLYLTTHYCGKPIPVFNLSVNYLLWKAGIKMFVWPEANIREPMPCENFQQRWRIVQHLLQQADQKGLDTEGKDELAGSLAARLQLDYGDLRASRMFQILTEEEAAQVDRAGIDLQLHTHRHRTPRDRAAFVREIQDNRDRLRKITGRETTHFCYPSGDYDRMFLPWLRELGVESATTCEHAFAKVDSEPLLLPRLLDGMQLTALDFESWLCGIRQQ